MNRTIVRQNRQHSKLSLLAFLVLIVVSASGLALWRVKSVQVLSVESGSMAPAIRRGDAVVMEPAQPAQLRVGDVVTYRSPADQSVLITHRIVQVEPYWHQIVTKGDNAGRTDRPVASSEVIGTVHARLKYLGFGLDFLRTPVGLVTAVYIPALIIISLELKRLARYYTQPTYRLLGYIRTR